MLHPIVNEELDLLERVNRTLVERRAPEGPSEASIVAELERLREMLREGEKTEDHAALLQQWDRQNALLQQIRASKQAPQVDPNSPYFAHMRLKENGTERDILLGKATRLEREVKIVDWRNAPISKIFYRYRQGEEYEEEIAGRVVRGKLTVRRTVTIRERELQRVEAPEGVFVRDPEAPEGWSLRAERAWPFGPTMSMRCRPVAWGRIPRAFHADRINICPILQASSIRSSSS